MPNPSKKRTCGLTVGIFTLHISQQKCLFRGIVMLVKRTHIAFFIVFLFGIITSFGNETAELSTSSNDLGALGSKQEDTFTNEKSFNIGSIKNECGPLAVLTIAKFWGIKSSLSEIRNLTGHDFKRGTMIGGIRRAFEALGLRTISVKIDYNTLLEIIDHNIPAVVGFGINHVAIVLPPVNEGQVLLVDPTITYCRYISPQKFHHLWDKTAIFIHRSDSANPLDIANSMKYRRIRHSLYIAMLPLTGAGVLLALRIRGKRNNNPCQQLQGDVDSQFCK